MKKPLQNQACLANSLGLDWLHWVLCYPNTTAPVGMQAGRVSTVRCLAPYGLPDLGHMAQMCPQWGRPAIPRGECSQGPAAVQDALSVFHGILFLVSNSWDTVLRSCLLGGQDGVEGKEHLHCHMPGHATWHSRLISLSRSPVLQPWPHFDPKAVF